MFKIYSSFLFFVFLFTTNAQNTIIVKGSLYDVDTQTPLELATVYVSTAKDSTVIEYATTDKNGDFTINTKKYDKAIFFKINSTGYETYMEQFNTLIENKDFGKLYLLKKENLLNEVVIKSEEPPIRIKQDTLEFNAASYKDVPMPT